MDPSRELKNEVRATRGKVLLVIAGMFAGILLAFLVDTRFISGMGSSTKKQALQLAFTIIIPLTIGYAAASKIDDLLWDLARSVKRINVEWEMS